METVSAIGAGPIAAIFPLPILGPLLQLVNIRNNGKVHRILLQSISIYCTRCVLQLILCCVCVCVYLSCLLIAQFTMARVCCCVLRWLPSACTVCLLTDQLHDWRHRVGLSTRWPALPLAILWFRLQRLLMRMPQLSVAMHRQTHTHRLSDALTHLTSHPADINNTRISTDPAPIQRISQCAILNESHSRKHNRTLYSWVPLCVCLSAQ